MSEEEKKFLEIVDLKKGFGSGETRQEVLRGMNFSVAKGEFCVLLGPSGSGKSTLLNIIGGIDSADSGYISINGDKLEDMSEKKLTQYRRKHLGYVFQMYNLIANLNVKENIEVGAYLSDNALDIDELLQIEVIDDSIVLKKAFKHKTFEERVAEYNGEISICDYDWGEPVGKEIL